MVCQSIFFCFFILSSLILLPTQCHKKLKQFKPEQIMKDEYLTQFQQVKYLIDKYVKEPVTKDIDLYAKASKIDSLIDQIGMMKERMGKMLAFVDKLITRFNDDVKIINDLKSGAVLTVLAVQAGRPNVDENPNEKMTTYIFKKVTDWEDNQDKIIAMPVGNKDQINARNRKIDELVTLNEKSNTKLSVIKDALQKFMETYDKQIKQAQDNSTKFKNDYAAKVGQPSVVAPAAPAASTDASTSTTPAPAAPTDASTSAAPATATTNLTTGGN